MYSHTFNSYTTSKNPKIFVLLAALLAFVVLISSCKDDEPTEGQAEVMIVNSASGSAAQDFYLDDIKVNAQAVAYSQNSGYITTRSGDNRKAEFKNTGSTTVNWSSTADINAGEKYTFFFTNSSSASSNSNSGLMLQDDTTAPPSGKAKVRFVNLAQGYTTANLLVIGGATWATNTTFGTASSYINVDPGTFNLQTSLSSNLTAAVSLGNFTLQAGKVYTIYTRGVINGTASTAVGASLIVHN